METIQLPARTVPLRGHYDVIVAGGGTAGAFAGIAAAKQGLKTLIVEQYGALGGSATLSLVTPLMAAHIEGYLARCSIASDLEKRLADRQAIRNAYYFDPAMLAVVLEEMAVESGCRLLYHTVLIDACIDAGKINQIIIHNQDGFSALSADLFIDATGNADLAMLAGVPTHCGTGGVNQAVSLRYEMANIDFDAFHAHMDELGLKARNYFAMNTPGMAAILEQARLDGLLTAQDTCYFQAFGLPGKPGAMNFNCPELYTDGLVLDADFLTQKQIEGKQAVMRLVCFLRKRIRGFSQAYVTSIAPMVGVRESRRIESICNLTIDDLIRYKKYPDGIIANNYPVDVHGDEKLLAGIQFARDLPPEERYWEVPFRCMIPVAPENLLVAGRCAGFDFIAQSAARIQPICRAMGEAAGLGCALAKKSGLPFRDLEHSQVRVMMMAAGADRI